MYQFTANNTSVIRLSDGASIPADPENLDYREVLAWIYAGNVPLPAPAQTAEEIREQSKHDRALAVAAIAVTTAAGNTFDGDETSQGRMARAILGLNASGPTATVNWVLANNTVIQASAAELSEALALAGAAQAAIWVI